MAVLLHVASLGRVGVNADTRLLFVRSKKGKCHVNEAELLKIGCTKQQLTETFRRTPGADPVHRHENAAPLVLLSPTEYSDVQLPDEAEMLTWFGDLPADADISGDLVSVTSTCISDGGDVDADDAALADSFTSDAPLDLRAPFTASFNGASDLDDTARRLLLVEHELQNTQRRIQVLLPQSEPMMLAIAAALDEVRETVRNHRTDVQEEHNVSVARQLAFVFQ